MNELGRWTKDNGKPARAFIGLDQPDDGSPMQNAIVWVTECSCGRWVDCIAAKALDKACDIFGGASIERVKPVRAPR